MTTVLFICGCLAFIAFIMFLAAKVGSPEPEREVDEGALEGDLTAYVDGLNKGRVQ